MQQRKQVTVDVIEDVVFVGPGLASALKHKGSRIRVQRVVPNWVAYTEAFDEASGVVVLQADLSDHVPVVLKVRALSAIEAAPIVLARQPSAVHVQRLLEAGAAVVVTQESSFDELMGMLIRVGQSDLREKVTSKAAGLSSVKLSDRELQVACLYAGEAAPSVAVIAQLLGIPVTSARTHLQRARRALREVGDTSNRALLREVLQSDGWLDADGVA